MHATGNDDDDDDGKASQESVAKSIVHFGGAALSGKVNMSPGGGVVANATEKMSVVHHKCVKINAISLGSESKRKKKLEKWKGVTT